MKDFKRIPQRKILGGVCAGIAYYLGFKVWLVRLIVALLSLSSFGLSVVIYILFWVFTPEYMKVPEDISTIE